MVTAGTRWLGVGAALACALACTFGCARTQRLNRPLEPARGVEGAVGFGRAAAMTVTENGVAQGSVVTTRVAQAATVEPGPRGDRLWRVGADGSQLEYCQLVDESPYDCLPVLPLPAYEPAIIEPNNLGWAQTLASYSDGRTTTTMRSGRTVSAGTLPASPRFGVWLANTALRVLPVAYGGVVHLGSALSFCHVHPEEGPRCRTTDQIVSRVLAVHVLHSAGRIVHVVWAQALEGEAILRCAADDEIGKVNCEAAKEQGR